VRILFACSSGGHLAQLTALDSWWSEHERHWVTFDTADARASLAGESITWGFHPTTRNIPNLLRNTRLAWKVLRRERPDVVMSTGAAIAVPFFLLARTVGARTVYLEVYDRIDSSTLTGRICTRLSDRFLVQWDEQQELYPGSVVVGPVW
jgi:UDP-N-acetylglucosamine:LPS N-acetylglucosamine transferase